MLALDVKIIGINNRNLKTFEVNLDTTKKLSDMVTPEMRKAGKLLVSESGVADTDDIKVLAKSGADALLIGTVLMEAVKPQELIAEFKGVYDNECDKTELIDQNGLTEVKICGITSMADVNLLIKYGADYGGMVVFYPKSKRDVTIEEAGRMVGILKKSDIVPESITGGLGTVATRADIIDKLFGSYLVEKKENEIFITSKAKQLLALVPEDLKKPELTAEWESRLSAIAKGKASDRKFMREIATYTKELMKQIQNGTGTFRHDNLTNKICPECGKRLLLVNGKQGKLYVCQDRECGYKERISRLTNARCPVCHKKMELVGAKDRQKFVCSCGHKESMQAFENRRKKEGAGVSKKDVANYMKKMKKEEKQPLNNALADALANLKL